MDQYEKSKLIFFRYSVTYPWFHWPRWSTEDGNPLMEGTGRVKLIKKEEFVSQKTENKTDQKKIQIDRLYQKGVRLFSTQILGGFFKPNFVNRYENLRKYFRKLWCNITSLTCLTFTVLHFCKQTTDIKFCETDLHHTWQTDKKTNWQTGIIDRPSHVWKD